ncbi:hypothetical protein PTT_00761 [Pyrenophora teres f. teres 0-1]|uniref:Uncharacterized protein n=1 Tax=Pyrenophora teres f. teres (strain 0-1) TaxID=861557 RepID=E3RCP5_PYRTT|nr:hypothetical protein PTT_00761 [Pyrenophora teres f. teres 0-1]
MQATPYQHPSAYDISKRPNQYPCPRTVAEFHALIEEHDRALRHTGSPTHVHNAHTCIKDCKRSLVDYYEINNINQPTRIRRPLTFQSHHALVLSQEVTETLSEPFRRGTNEQLEALAMWRWVLRDTSQTAVLQRLGRFDARRVKEREMEALLSNFATIFFRTTLVDEMRFTFSWREMDDDTLGYCQGPVGIGNPSVIRMDPFKVGDEVDPSTTNKHGLNGRAVERLETVLHELVHAYLQHYSCKSCASYEDGRLCH